MKLQSDRYTTGEKALTREEYDKLVKIITDLQDELMIWTAPLPVDNKLSFYI